MTYLEIGVTLRWVPKQTQLQIRVSESDKSAIRTAAKRAGLDMSAYILSRLLPAPAGQFQHIIAGLAGSTPAAYALADLNVLLTQWTAGELRDAVAHAPKATLPPCLANYVAAMVETACSRRALAVPAWTHGIEPLDAPMFGSSLQSLRLHLLTRSPAAFRRRNIFIDSSLGDRV